MITQKRKRTTKQTLWLREENDSSSIDMIIDYVGQIVRSLHYLPRTLFFPVACE